MILRTFFPIGRDCLNFSQELLFERGSGDEGVTDVACIEERMRFLTV